MCCFFVLFFVVVIALTDLEIDHANDIPQYFCAKYSCYNWKQLRVVKVNLTSNTGSACAITRARGSWLKCLTSRSNWNLEMLVFEERENRSARRKTSQNRIESQQQTQPTYDAGSENRTRDTLVGGERAHHCANPAPQSNLPFFCRISNWTTTPCYTSRPGFLHETLILLIEIIHINISGDFHKCYWNARWHIIMSCNLQGQFSVEHSNVLDIKNDLT